MTTAVELDKVSFVFGDRPERALSLMDEGLSRSEIQTRTGHVVLSRFGAAPLIA